MSVSESTATEEYDKEKGLDHSWRYFALHAQQRISVFNFFVVLSGVLATGIGAALQAGRPMALVAATLGALLTLFSIVFSRLDRRSAELVKLVEVSLIAGESICMPPFARIFTNEAAASSAAPQPSAWTFGRSFRLIFWLMGLAGATASLVSLYRSLQT